MTRPNLAGSVLRAEELDGLGRAIESRFLHPVTEWELDCDRVTAGRVLPSLASHLLCRGKTSTSELAREAQLGGVSEASTTDRLLGQLGAQNYDPDRT